jgi:signal transduction histidine kinase
MRLTLRARLTIVYGGLFLVAGVLLLFLTYSLVRNHLPEGEGSRTVVGVKEDTELQIPEPGEDLETYARDVRFMVAGEVWEDALFVIATQGGLALALVSIATVALGWLVAGRMLRPIQGLTDTAARIAEAPAAGQGLHERIKVEGPQDELRELAETFNRMLERLDHSFDGQRSFISNASHELRTPLTVTRALLEVALHRPGASPDVRQLSETLLEVNAPTWTSPTSPSTWSPRPPHRA